MIIFVVVAIIGIAVIPGLRVNLNPSSQAPKLRISYSLPNSSPDIVERLATSPLENALSQIEGVNRTYSISKYNTGVITLDFDKDEDIEFRKFEINSIIRNIYKKLPENMSYPRVDQTGGESSQPQSTAILFYSVNGPYAPYKLQQDVDEYIGKGLSQIKDVKEVSVRGATPLQITVDFDVATLVRYDLSKGQIRAALGSFNEAVFAGMARTSSNQQFFLKTAAQLPDLSGLGSTEITKVEGKSIFLKDVAKIYVEEQQPNTYKRINGKNAVYVTIDAREGVNKIVLAEQVRTEIERLSKSLPVGVELRLERDDTEYLRGEMDKIYTRTLLSVFILIVFILLINRNVRYLVTLFVGILINLCITSVIVYALKVELHLYSIAGVTISFGLIVDNAIVMLDHVHRKKNAKIFVALLAASLTTIMSLLIVLLLPEEDRANLTDFSIVIAINLAVSLVIALFFTPALYSLLFKEGSVRKAISTKGLRRRVKFFRAYLASVSFVVRFRKTFIVLVILAFGIPVFKLPLQWEGQEWYNDTIGSDKYQDDIRPVTDKILGGALRKFVTEVYEGYSFRSNEQTKLKVTARLPFGTTLEDANFVISKVEDYLKDVKGVDKYVTDVSTGKASMVITFKPEYNDSALPYQLKARLQARSLDLTGVQWSISGVGRGFNVGGERGESPSYKIRMKGYNYDVLGDQADALAEKLLESRRVQEVKTNEQVGWGNARTSEYVLDFDIERLASSGISRGEVMAMLGDLTKPTGVSFQANYKNERLPVYIKASNADEFSKYDLMQEALPLDTSRFIKISDYASLVFEQSANEIHKEDRQYLRIVGFDYLGSNKFGAKHRDAKIKEMKVEMPVGYEIEGSNSYFRYEKDKKKYGLLIYLIIGIFFICAVLFESLKQPFHIIITIPISFIGLFLIFSVGDFSFDQGGYAAFVMLGGLVVNASIFIVNDLNNTTLKNYNRAVAKSVMGKAQPILLTILSTCFGLIPFLIEGENEVFWFALAIGTIGGLVFSLVAVFVCLPIFLSRKVKKLKAVAVPAASQ